MSGPRTLRGLAGGLVALILVWAGTACTGTERGGPPSGDTADAASEALERALDEAEQRSEEAENPPEPGSEGRVDAALLADPAPAIAAFRTEVGEAPRATEVYLYAGDYAIGVFQDPAKPENLDRYVYRDGAVEPPEPVRVSQADIDAYPEVLFDLDAVNWAAVPQLVREARTRLGPEVEGAEVSAVAVFRIASIDPARPTFVVSVAGTRRSGVLRATADGVVIDAALS